MQIYKKKKRGAAYMVSFEVNRKDKAFLDASNCRMFFKVLRDAKRKYSFKYTLYLNKAHEIILILRTGKSVDISVLMKWLKTTFTKRYNAEYGLTGHFWKQHFKSTIIENSIFDNEDDKQIASKQKNIIPYLTSFNFIIHSQILLPLREVLLKVLTLNLT